MSPPFQQVVYLCNILSPSFYEELCASLLASPGLLHIQRRFVYTTPCQGRSTRGLAASRPCSRAPCGGL